MGVGHEEELSDLDGGESGSGTVSLKRPACVQSCCRWGKESESGERGVGAEDEKGAKFVHSD